VGICAGVRAATGSEDGGGRRSGGRAGGGAGGRGGGGGGGGGGWGGGGGGGGGCARTRPGAARPVGRGRGGRDAPTTSARRGSINSRESGRFGPIPVAVHELGQAGKSTGPPRVRPWGRLAVAPHPRTAGGSVSRAVVGCVLHIPPGFFFWVSPSPKHPPRGWGLNNPNPAQRRDGLYSETRVASPIGAALQTAPANRYGRPLAVFLTVDDLCLGWER